MKTLKGIALALSLSLLLPTLATAQEEFQLEFSVSHRMQEGQGRPSISIASPIALREATLHLSRAGGWEHGEAFGVMHRGQRRRVEFDQPAGTYGYRGRLEGINESGQTLSFDFTFDVTVVPGLQIEILLDRVDLGQGVVPLRVNRPVQRVELEVRGEGNRRLLRTSQDFGGRQGELVVRYEPRGEVMNLELTVHDEDGFWESVILEPFWVEIPHETVNFRTGSAAIDSSEEPKLRDTLGNLRQLMNENNHMDLRLYIAGYTDTVGSAESNRRLSERRARAIGQWFRDNGLSIPIFYQGFGQDALAVETPDETEEAANRRALYILGNAPPPTSSEIPRGEWRRVR